MNDAQLQVLDGPSVFRSDPGGGPHDGRRVALPIGMLTLLIILLLVALLGGGIGYGRFGAAGMGPAGLIVVILLVLLLMGRL